MKKTREDKECRQTKDGHVYLIHTLTARNKLNGRVGVQTYQIFAIYGQRRLDRVSACRQRMFQGFVNFLRLKGTNEMIAASNKAP
jgi:hypothetical protein